MSAVSAGLSYATQSGGPAPSELTIPNAGPLLCLEPTMPWSKQPDPLPPRGDAKEKVLIGAIAVLTILQAIATYFLIREVLAG